MVWAILAFLFISWVMCAIAIMQGNRHPRWRLIRRLATASFVGTICLMIVVYESLSWYRRHYFISMSTTDITSARLCIGQDYLPLDHQTVIHLQTAIAAGDWVWAHHSHPEDTFVLELDVKGQGSLRYALSKDSDEPNEFWVSVRRDRDSSVGWLGQVQSEKLAQILDELLRNDAWVTATPPEATELLISP